MSLRLKEEITEQITASKTYMAGMVGRLKRVLKAVIKQQNKYKNSMQFIYNINGDATKAAKDKV